MDPFTGPSVHLVLKTLWPNPYCLALVNHWIDRQCPPMDRRFIWRLCLCCFTSGIHPAHLGNGPSVHPTVPCSSLLFFGSDPPNIYTIFSFCHVAFLHPWDLEMSAKTCSTIWLVPLVMLSRITKIKLEQIAYEAMFSTRTSTSFFFSCS
jgi:hypothetical protein